VRIGRFTIPKPPPWARRAGRYAGYPLFGLLVFLTVLYLSMPWTRVRDRVESDAQTAGWDIRIGSLGPAFLFGVKARDVVLRTHPANPQEKPLRLVFDQVVAHPGIIGLITRHPSVGFWLGAFGGEVEGHYSDSGDVEARLTGRALDLGQIPGLESATRLPLAGVVKVDVDLALPKGRFSEAGGEATLECKGCSVGDGKAKVPLGNNSFFSEGLTVPKIGLGNVEGKITVDRGTAKIASLETHSADLDLKVEGDVTLRDPPNFSSVNVCVAFRPTQALIKRDPKFEVLSQAPDLQNAKRPDGYYTVRMSGRLDALFAVPARCGAGSGPVPPGASARGGFRPMPSGGPSAPSPSTFQPPAPSNFPTPQPQAPPPPPPQPSLPPPPPPPAVLSVDAAVAPPTPPPVPPEGAMAPHVGTSVRGAVLAPPAEQPGVVAPPPPPAEDQ
jgi:type II secretion system protein N